MSESSPQLSFRKFFRKQLRFGWWWIPAVITGGVGLYIQGGLPRVGLALFVAFPLCTLGATWWEWRKTGNAAGD